MALTRLAEGINLQVGGAGTGNGYLLDLLDTAFDTQGNLYTLEGGATFTLSNGVVFTGNRRIQKFNPGQFNPALFVPNKTNDVDRDAAIAQNNANMFVTKFSLADAGLGANNNTQRFAITSDGHFWVPISKAGIVKRFNAAGVEQNANARISIPRAFAIKRGFISGSERLFVIGSSGNTVENQVHVIDPATNEVTPITLGKNMTGVSDLAIHPIDGRIVVQANVRQIHIFSPGGTYQRSIGSATTVGTQDGSEVMHRVEFDSQGNLYTMAPGNPGRIMKFDAQLKTVSSRGGQWGFADPWSIHSGYIPLKVDPSDNVWIGSIRVHDPAGVNFSAYHFSPAEARLNADYLSLQQSGVTQNSALLQGLTTTITSEAPYGIQYDKAPFALTFRVAPGVRLLSSIDVDYWIVDIERRVRQSGAFSVALVDGVAATHPITYEPTDYHWFDVIYRIKSEGEVLASYSKQFGTTPFTEADNMRVLAQGDAIGGWSDAAMQKFAGLPCQRISCVASVSGQTRAQAVAERVLMKNRAVAEGNTWFCQFVGESDLAPDCITDYVNAMPPGTLWEILNEPDISGMLMPTYVQNHLIPAATLIKQLDPTAKIMAPSLCGFNLPRFKAFFDADGHLHCHIISGHDYEGNESIDQTFWRKKFSEVRKIMAQYGAQDMELWQTERTLAGVRSGVFMPRTQCIRATMHRDLLETLGIPNRKNMLYYMWKGGYSAIPAYLYSENGPHPAALALRTRHAMTEAKNRSYAEELDFGVHGRDMFLGLRYSGADGHTIILRNLGTVDQYLRVGVNTGASVGMVDAFGNASILPVVDGAVVVPVSQLPTYLLLTLGQSVTVPQIYVGKNLAEHATVTYPAGTVTPDQYKGDISKVTDGVLGHVHDEAPGQPPKLWFGNLPIVNGVQAPQYLPITLDQAYLISRLRVRGQRADNPYSALLDYDLERRDIETGEWVLVEAVRSNVAATDWVTTGDTLVTQWYDDTNYFVHQFAPVMVREFRLKILRCTNGYCADALAAEGRRRAVGGTALPSQVVIREIEIFGDFPEYSGSGPVIGDGNGLWGTYYDNPTFTGPHFMQRLDPKIDFNWGSGAPDLAMGVDTFSVRWTGKLKAQYSELYTFTATADDSLKLTINGTTVIAGGNQKTGTFQMVAGQLYDVVIDYVEQSGGASTTLSWQSTSTPKTIIPRYQFYTDQVGPVTDPPLTPINTVFSTTPFTPPADTTAPPVPVLTSAVPGNTRVDLIWSASLAGDVAGYDIERNGAVQQFGNVLSYSDIGLSNNVLHTYRVRARDTSGNLSDWSAPLAATPIADDTTAPPVPTLFAPVAGNARVDLTWSAVVADDLAGYDIERSGAVVSLGNVTAYADTGLSNGAQRTYRVRSRDSNGNVSLWSAALSATPTAPSSEPPTVPPTLPIIGKYQVINPHAGDVVLFEKPLRGNVDDVGRPLIENAVFATPTKLYCSDGTVYSRAPVGPGEIEADLPLNMVTHPVVFKPIIGSFLAG
jgi:chitodextrinase